MKFSGHTQVKILKETQQDLFGFERIPFLLPLEILPNKSTLRYLLLLPSANPKSIVPSFISAAYACINSLVPTYTRKLVSASFLNLVLSLPSSLANPC